ncbi:thioesterase II family protein [Actinokineospora bangkokensis]|uniref:Thioesterase TesA-like domain-containing protein n=1 Tax=Actinokineospora bangkokensis TaxID=1193682 RepID=A0A1Q9LM08_9PSEU|nr:alpha/beta fold hydrolase [Actinokineospora bangkokensis]OLR93051.1 hypothetical protein BJP25_19050 [Actinokineospora bangkokensis]
MTPAATASPWLRRPKPRPGAALRLVCVPHAGAGPSSFARWIAELAPDVEVCIAALPGRESRFTEPPVTDVDVLADELTAATAGLGADLPVALFGHSMGAVLAYEVAHRLPTPPAHLVASGSLPPQVPDLDPRIAHLPDAEFLARVRAYGGIPDAVCADPDLLALLLPVLRADFAACEGYRFTERPPLDCPVTALCGSGDRYVDEAALGRWGELTTGECVTRVIGAGHFNLVEDRAAVLGFLRARLGVTAEGAQP